MFGAHSKYITKVLLSPDVKCVLSCPFLSGTQELSFPSILKQGWSRLTSVLPFLPLMLGSPPGLDTSRRARPTRRSRSGLRRTLSSSSSACSRATSAGCGTVLFRPTQRTSSLVRSPSPPCLPSFFPPSRAYGVRVSGADISVCVFTLASSDHVARLWELATGETVRQYNGHHRCVLQSLPLSFSFLARTLPFLAGHSRS